MIQCQNAKMGLRGLDHFTKPAWFNAHCSADKGQNKSSNSR